MVDSIFLPHEAKAIKSIPLSVCFPSDKLMWAEMANGKFTVKSAYHLVVRISSSDTRGSVSDCSLMSRAVHPIRQPDPPEDSDRIRPENRPTRSSHWSVAGHLFQKPTPAGRSRFSSQNPKKPDPTDVLRISSKKILESGRNF